MAETKSPHESALPVKRKPDLTSQDHDPQRNLPHKSPKLQTQDEIIQPIEEDHALHPSGNNDSSVSGPGPENRDPGIDSGEGEEGDDDEYEEDDANEEEWNGSTTVDRKGKGILIEEENDSHDEDDDDDSSDGGTESEVESDLSDDPLAEVDLDNILPSRTRRQVVRPGVHIAKKVGNKGEADDNDDSDS
ncbi:Long chain base2 isoform 1 [Hibiscus syriacus]|uniref:Long chain base2 isoform 1 n=1 Tax=Hibiscus syriacus TaxID=106335 RepID=A0A6A3BIK8_HIBSY|nr:ribosome biogenesis protein BOP1 homolog [Hibiscus syriacus]KAE8715867.1 Long chain base2 isoform 1 [Hibiscus syriacus]